MKLNFRMKMLEQITCICLIVFLYFQWVCCLRFPAISRRFYRGSRLTPTVKSSETQLVNHETHDGANSRTYDRNGRRTTGVTREPCRHTADLTCQPHTAAGRKGRIFLAITAPFEQPRRLTATQGTPIGIANP